MSLSVVQVGAGRVTQQLIGQKWSQPGWKTFHPCDSVVDPNPVLYKQFGGYFKGLPLYPP